VVVGLAVVNGRTLLAGPRAASEAARAPAVAELPVFQRADAGVKLVFRARQSGEGGAIGIVPVTDTAPAASLELTASPDRAVRLQMSGSAGEIVEFTITDGGRALVIRPGDEVARKVLATDPAMVIAAALGRAKAEAFGTVSAIVID
jgi:hypothetical protein